jgi:putative FmdB family regulatory protein
VPIYEYECTGCGHGFELRQSFSAEPAAQCPVCQARAERVLHPVPIFFKGSGFYVNDYKRSTVSDVPPPKKESEPSSDGKGNGKGAPTDIKVGSNESKPKRKPS